MPADTNDRSLSNGGSGKGMSEEEFQRNHDEYMGKEVASLSVDDSELDAGGKAALVADLAKQRFQPAIPAIARLLTHPNTALRTAALNALARYFKQQQYWDTARRFLLDDPSDLGQVQGAASLGDLKEDTSDPRTLAVLGRVVRDEARDELVRGQAYAAMRRVRHYDAREQWHFGGKNIQDIPDVDWAWVDRCIAADPDPNPSPAHE